MPSGSFTTDACQNGGAGAYNADWFYAHWQWDFPDIADLHINLKELYAVYIASIRWASSWENKHIVVYSDNATTVFMINKGASKNSIAMKWLRRLFWLSAINNFHITARHIKGKDNVISDTLSRLDEIRVADWMEFIRTEKLDGRISDHISQKTLHYLLLKDRMGNCSKKSNWNSNTMFVPH